MRSASGAAVLVAACLSLAACDAPPVSSAPSAPSSVRAAPSSVPSAAPSAAPSAKPSSASPPAGPAKISKAGLQHFFAVALGSEYGDEVDVVRMWTGDRVTVRVHGGNRASRDCLNDVIADFNALTATTDLKLTKGDADIDLRFAPLSKFRSIEPTYVAGNDGFVYLRWSDSYAATSANVLVRSSGISEAIRCHLIREELTQGMGLLRDSSRHPESMFYTGYLPAPTRYSALDEEVIRFLYSGKLRPGANRKAVTRAAAK